LIAVVGVAAMEGARAETVKYVKDRKALGRTIAKFPNTQFKLAEIATKTRIARVFIDDCNAKIVDGTLDTVTASMAKYRITGIVAVDRSYIPTMRGRFGPTPEARLVGRLSAGSGIWRLQRRCSKDAAPKRTLQVLLGRGRRAYSLRIMEALSALLIWPHAAARTPWQPLFGFATC
jgi:hypothetical protein